MKVSSPLPKLWKTQTCNPCETRRASPCSQERSKQRLQMVQGSAGRVIERRREHGGTFKTLGQERIPFGPRWKATTAVVPVIESQKSELTEHHRSDKVRALRRSMPLRHSHRRSTGTVPDCTGTPAACMASAADRHAQSPSKRNGLRRRR